MNRREFLHRAAAAGSVLLALPDVAAPSIRPASRVLFTGGLVYDGLGSPPVEADVFADGDRIVAVGKNIDAGNASIVSISGLAIAPGFIDIHGHTDLSLLVDGRAVSKVHQGVTTEVVGQDGDSMGPLREDVFVEIRDAYMQEYGVLIDFRFLPEFFSRVVRSGSAINLASMVGAGTIRQYVVGDEDREATPTEMDEMKALVRAALANGACGLSSGLEYLPGAFASTHELIALAAELRDTGLPYATHMRNEDDSGLAAIEEALHIGRMAGVPVQISHLKALGQRNWWKAPIALGMIDAARADGLDVTADRYPYEAYSTTLAALFPVWVREGGTQAFLGRLNDPSLEASIEAAVVEKVDRLGDWNSAQVTMTVDEGLSWANGRRLGELAAERGEQPFRLLRDLIVGDRNRTGMVGFGMDEENTALILSHPATMICSDGGARAPSGPLAGGSPHPRCYGSFPRILGHYARERKAFPLETAIMKMTSMPADRIRLPDRGRIKQGAFADFVVFDPDRVADRATFEDPHQLPVGIHHVMVNGEFVVWSGEHTLQSPGRILHPSLG
ncbi:MAG TPA: D-aminoacylase [Rhodothermales bacterium]|nr:D-aminoacylase [Rhodothermales bacterium]